MERVVHVDDHLITESIDAPGPGGAHHVYRSKLRLNSGQTPTLQTIRFQNGPINEFGANGVTNEALLSMVIDRLQCFQNGPFKCEENAEALYHAQCALGLLEARTAERKSRGVEGTHQA